MSEVNDQKKFLVLFIWYESRDYVFKMSIFIKKLSTLVHVYVHIKQLRLRAAVVANRSITASMLGCQIGGFVAS